MNFFFLQKSSFFTLNTKCINVKHALNFTLKLYFAHAWHINWNKVVTRCLVTFFPPSIRHFAQLVRARTISNLMDFFGDFFPPLWPTGDATLGDFFTRWPSFRTLIWFNGEKQFARFVIVARHCYARYFKYDDSSYIFECQLFFRYFQNVRWDVVKKYFHLLLNAYLIAPPCTRSLSRRSRKSLH